MKPAFDSQLVDLVTELEYLRKLRLAGTTPAPVFFQLKEIFHMLESLGSARIKGNHTTLADYVESRLEMQSAELTDQLKEMTNIEEAMSCIEDYFEPGQELSELFVRELHALTVQGLKREGDETPRSYRKIPVQISQSDHQPPDLVRVPEYMAELVKFINHDDPAKYDLMTSVGGRYHLHSNHGGMAVFGGDD